MNTNENKIILKLKEALNEALVSSDDFSDISEFLIKELKTIAIHLQQYEVACHLRGEQRKRLNKE
jgi:hypothetical protein